MRLRGILLSCAVVLGLGVTSGGALAAQDTFTCADFLTQDAAQSHLDRFPNDPYGLDPDGNGVACEDFYGSGASAQETQSTTEIAQEAALPLDGRVGGTVESFQAEYGMPLTIEGVDGARSTSYAIPEIGSTVVDDEEGRITSISLFAPRAAGEEWSNVSHPLNWSVAEARNVAEEFFPQDAHIDPPIDEVPYGFTQTMCTSEALTAEVPSSIYDAVDDTPQYGRCNAILWYANYEDTSQISWISVSLDIDEPPDDSAETVEVAQQADGDQANGFSTEEQAYVADLVDIVRPVGEGLTHVGELFMNPRLGDDEWTTEIIVEFILWQSAYQDIQALTPPPAFAEIHAQYVESLRLITEASDEILLALDTGDVQLLNQAMLKIDQAHELILYASSLFEILSGERGG